jgi:hypothetical protein
VALGSSLRSDGPGAPVTGFSNAVTLSVPAERYADVVRLVAGGFVSRFLGFEGIDDVQLAVEAVIRSVPVEGSHVRVSLASDDEWLSVGVGGLEAGAIEGRLRRVVNDGIALGTLLGRLVDSVQVVDGSIVMRKRSPSAA